MKGLSRKKFSQVGRRVCDWFSAASYSTLLERLNYHSHAASRVAQATRGPVKSGYQAANHSILPKLLKSDFRSP